MFIYSEKATKFYEIFPLLLTTVHTAKSKGKISQNFVAFSEYMNFNGPEFLISFKRVATEIAVQIEVIHSSINYILPNSKYYDRFFGECMSCSRGIVLHNSFRT